jgi:hypothetical protein
MWQPSGFDAPPIDKQANRKDGMMPFVRFLEFRAGAA